MQNYWSKKDPSILYWTFFNTISSSRLNHKKILSKIKNSIFHKFAIEHFLIRIMNN